MIQPDINQPDLILYQYPACPYCRKVLRYVDDRGLHIPRKDTRADPDARAELIRIGGKSQVPALVIDGDVLYESDAIIAWLRSNMPENG